MCPFWPHRKLYRVLLSPNQFYLIHFIYFPLPILLKPNGHLSFIALISLTDSWAINHLLARKLSKGLHIIHISNPVNPGCYLQLLLIHDQPGFEDFSCCKQYFFHQGLFCPKSTLEWFFLKWNLVADLTLDPLSHLQKLHHRSTHGLGAYSGPTYIHTHTHTDRLNFIIWDM